VLVLKQDPCFKVEAQHVVVFVFTESRVALLWVYMAVMCCWVERIQIENGAGWSVRQVAAVLGRSVSMVSQETRLEQMDAAE